MTPKDTITEAIRASRRAAIEQDADSQARFADLGKDLTVIAGVQSAALLLAGIFLSLAVYNAAQASWRFVACTMTDGWLSASYASSVGDSLGALCAWALLAGLCWRAYQGACSHADVLTDVGGNNK